MIHIASSLAWRYNAAFVICKDHKRSRNFQHFPITVLAVLMGDKTSSLLDLKWQRDTTKFVVRSPCGSKQAISPPKNYSEDPYFHSGWHQKPMKASTSPMTEGFWVPISTPPNSSSSPEEPDHGDQSTNSCSHHRTRILSDFYIAEISTFQKLTLLFLLIKQRFCLKTVQKNEIKLFCIF